jgi:hypothetical protein
MDRICKATGDIILFWTAIRNTGRGSAKAKNPRQR